MRSKLQTSSPAYRSLVCRASLTGLCLNRWTRRTSSPGKIVGRSASGTSQMQERTRLENAIKACQQLENQMNGHVELIELGEAEGDADVAESEALWWRKRNMEVETLLSGEADGNIPPEVRAVPAA